MTWETYRTEALKSAVYPPEHGKDYVLLGLFSEIGELAGIAKRILRGDYTMESVRDEILDELGDVCWYVAACAKESWIRLWRFSNISVVKGIDLSGVVLEMASGGASFRQRRWPLDLTGVLDCCEIIALSLDSSLSEVLEMNIAKTRDRMERGVVRGQGGGR